ncbi:MAG: patatin-like phospholipase family protein [Candidatus Omnitrophica bacterium]|nr:patatin-like phospholipase family protein [Candidatus Omnitrophota bacterium]
MELLVKEILARTHPFTKLTPKQLDKIFAVTETKEYKAGQIVYEEGAAPDSIYILIKGRLMALSSQGTEEVEIELIKKGKPFGIISVLTEEPHSVTVKAIENSLVLTIEKEKFRKFLMRSPHLAFDFSQMLSKRVKKRSGRPKKIFQSLTISAVSSTDSPQRIRFLVDVSRELSVQTRRKIIAVEISFDGAFAMTECVGQMPAVLDVVRFEEESLGRYIFRHQGIDILCVKVPLAEIGPIFALFNYLAENYHFIFYTLPPLAQESLLELVHMAHVVYFLSIERSSELMVIHRIEQILEKRKGRMNVLDLSGQEIAPAAVRPVLPEADSSRYPYFLKKLARSLGEKTIGIVLGSGGAFGYAHIGVLKVLRAHKVPIDILSGSSMGALIAALWALGYSDEDITRYAAEFGRLIRVSPFSFFTLPLKGFFKAKKVEAFLRNVFAEKDFSCTNTQLRIVAFDFLKRQSHIIEEGLVYKAVAASCAMPGLVEPILFEDTILLDGGVLNPVPVNSVTDYAKKIIAVNVTPSREEIVREYRKTSIGKLTIFDFIFGSIETMQREFIEKALSAADCVIHPDMENLRWTEFSRIEEFITRGEKAALAHLEKIIHLRDE